MSNPIAESISKIEADVKEAMSAFNSLQSQLTNVVVPLSEQIRGLRGLMEDAERATTEHRKLLVEHVEAVHTNWQEHFQYLSSSWTESHSRLLREIAAAIPVIQEAVKQADKVGALGWTITNDMGPTDVALLVKMDQVGQADEYMMHWYAESDPDLSYAEQVLLGRREFESFREPFLQTLSALRREEYAITIPFLTAVFERGLRHLIPPDHFFTRQVKTRIKAVYDTAQEHDPDSINVQIWMSLYTFLQGFYAQYEDSSSPSTRLLRHGVQHGLQPPPNDKTEVFRLFHVLKTTVDLMPSQAETS